MEAITTYVLIATFSSSVGIGGLSAEFNNKESCQNAKEQIIKADFKLNGLGDHTNLICVKK